MGDAMTNTIDALVRIPPDPNEVMPLANKAETLYGATVPFHVISWFAVSFRLYTRFKVVREPGLDDYLIILAAMFNLVALIALLCSLNFGLGTHFRDIFIQNLQNLGPCMKWLYIHNAAYFNCTGLVKMSLLFQYYRIFKKGPTRWVCHISMALVVIWTAIAFVQGWFPCFPVHGFWNRQITPTPKCWGLGYGNLDHARMALYGFAASNMGLDVIIFAIPMSVYFRPGIGRREITALTALFTLGSLVVLMAILRLWSIARHDAKDIISFDFPWWFPQALIFSSLEVDFAIITASIPIFWPVIAASMPQIFVTQEIHVTTHSRLDDTNEFEMGRPQSLKSNASTEGLTRLAAGKIDYNDPFSGNPTPQNRIEIAVKSPKKWGR